MADDADDADEHADEHADEEADDHRLTKDADLLLDGLRVEVDLGEVEKVEHRIDEHGEDGGLDVVHGDDRAVRIAVVRRPFPSAGNPPAS